MATSFKVNQPQAEPQPQPQPQGTTQTELGAFKEEVKDKFDKILSLLGQGSVSNPQKTPFVKAPFVNNSLVSTCSPLAIFLPSIKVLASLLPGQIKHRSPERRRKHGMLLQEERNQALP